MAKSVRRRLLVDPKVQGAILARIVVYWICCLLFITLPLVIAQSYFRPEQSYVQQLEELWSHAGPILTAALLILPLAIYDCLKVTHRFAGPLLRFRRELRRLADGQPVEPLRFRSNDFWHDLADSFNRLAERLEATGREQLAGERDGQQSELTVTAGDH